MRNVDAAGSRAWHDGLAALHRYVEVRHTAAPPTSARVEGFDLGEWVKQLRSCYWAGTLEPDRVELLEALPGWRWSGTHERQWRARLDALRRYAARNGTSAVPPGVVVGSRMRLGQWVAAQKASQAAGTLPRPAAELLEQVPGWEWEEQSQPEEETTRWTIVLDALRRKLGTGQQDEFDDGPPEAFPHDQWIRRLRDDYRNGTLPPAVVAQAEALPGWSWNPGEANWERGLHALQAWTSVHGGACPPQAAVIDGFPIGRWVHARRREYRAGKLPTDRSTLLATLPGMAVERLRRDVAGHIGRAACLCGRAWHARRSAGPRSRKPAARRVGASPASVAPQGTARCGSRRPARGPSGVEMGWAGVQLNRREFPRLGTLPAAHAAASAASAARIANTAG